MPVYHRSDARTSDMEISYSTSTVWTPVYHGSDPCTTDIKIVLKINHPKVRKPYVEITCSEHATVRTIVPHRPDAALKQERFSAKISKILVVQSSGQTAQVHRPNGVRTYYCSRPFDPSAYK